MKKMVFVLAMLFVVTSAFAEMGVQVIGGPETVSEPVSLDDLKVNEEVEIPGWGKILISNVEIQDKLGHYGAGRKGVYTMDGAGYYDSGKDAEFLVLYIDILNTALTDKNYLENATIKVVYDDVYEYGGWAYQRNYNNDTGTYYEIDADKDRQNTRWAINASDNFVVSPMYQGHYLFGCTLPNAVIDSKAPLRMEINLDGNEITYNIRK